MRETIFGFNQVQAVKHKLDLRDLLLLDYVINAVASPSMEHTVDDNNHTYVWLSHKKILEDLPIIDISEDRFKRVLKKLVDNGFLQTIQVHNSNRRGSKSYYGITFKCEELKNTVDVKLNEDTDQVLKITPDNTRPSVKNNTSDNKLNNNINTNNINIISRKSTKKNLYEKCIDLVDEFTNNTKLRNTLVIYVKMRLEIKDKPLYANQFKGMLNKLNTLADNSNDMLDIVQQSIDRGYLSFFPVNSYSKKSKDARVDIEQLGETNIPRVSDRDKEELERRVANGELEQF